MNTKTELAGSEFDLMREIARSPIRTQRELSQKVGLSLGMTNLLIKRLARKGLIKINQLDWNRTQYLLTIKGAMEKSRKMYDYTRYTIRIFRQIEENMTTVLQREHEGGRRKFWLVAQDELRDLLQEHVRELALEGATFHFCGSFGEVPAEADLVLAATQEAAPNGRRCVSLVDFDNIDFRII